MDYRVTHSIERMRERLHGELTIESLAAEVGLSASRFGFLFRHETGRSPGAYLQALRLERARLLLESTDLSVRDVMAQVGLSDPSHFSRDFRNAHGLSPRSYRLQLRLAGPPVRYIHGSRVVARAHDLHTNRPTGPRTAMPADDKHSHSQERAHENNEAVDGDGSTGVRDDDRRGGSGGSAGRRRR